MYYQSQSFPRQTTQKTGATVAASPTNLFTVAGGRVRIHEIFGLVTTQIGAVALTVKLEADVAGTDSDICAASATLQAKIVGTMVSVTGLPTDALVISAGEGAVRGPSMPFIVGPSTIRSVNTNVGEGAFTWYCTWESVDPGATLVAA